MMDIAAVSLKNPLRIQLISNCIEGAKIVSHIHHEMALHVDYCKGFGVSKGEMEACEESQGTFLTLLKVLGYTNVQQLALHTQGRNIFGCGRIMLTYDRYVLDIGQSEDWLALQMSMAPCLIGYGDIAKRLHSDPKTKRDGNIYWKWIENYVADDYTEAVRVGCGKSLSIPTKWTPNIKKTF
jgi:thiaminase